MPITYTISGVPLLNQLKEPTTDGQPDENERDNCVFASNAAMATAYLRKPFYGDELKDANPHYGQGYVGFASEANMVAQMAGLGITVARNQHSTQQLLIDELHQQIAQGHACICTIPSNWGTAPANPRAYSGYMHVVLMCGTGPGMLRALNCWGGFWQDESDAWWAARLLEGEIWVGTLSATAKETAMVPTGWKDDGKTLTAPNGVQIVQGFRDYVLAHSWAANNTPLAPERVVSAGSIEYGNASVGPGSRQDFRFCSLGWTQAWGVYVIAVGQDINALAQQTAALKSQVGTLTQQLATAQAAAKPDPIAANALDVATRLKALLGEL